MKKYAGEEFLNKLYKDLVHSDEVKHTAKGRNKNEDVSLYLERLERITNEARDKEKLDLLKYFYCKKYIIKEENVPESYFEHQEQIALARGYGHIIYDEQTKQQEIDSIISEQKASLDRWLEYFVSEDTKQYPMWFKYYVFQNIMKIGYFDKEKNEFTKRIKSTVKPFIEINREAIAMLYDELHKYLGKQNINDKQLEQLIKNGSFNKIYSYITRKLDNVRKSHSISNEGIWKKYVQGSNPEVLFNDIHGKGTGWCTAGGIETATSHLDGGDFHVYYTKDENGDHTIPRIAIRMENECIAEIRGISENQNLENEMECVVEEKLNEFPDKEEYKKKVNDMKILTEIYNKHNKKEELTKEELMFLYEIDSEILGFGYEKDPRINEIINNRNIKKDLSLLLDVPENEISLSESEALSGNIAYHYGDLYLKGIKNSEGLILPRQVKGYIQLWDLIDGEGLILPEKIGCFLDLSSLTSAKGVTFPKEIGSTLDLRNLKSAEGLILPEKIKGSLNLNDLNNSNGLILPKEVDGNLDLSNLTIIGELIMPEKLDGYIDLKNVTSAKKLVFPKEVIGIIDLRSLKDADGLILPEKLLGDLYLDNLKKAKGLILPKVISGKLDLLLLEDATGIVLPKNDQGEFYVPGSKLNCKYTKEHLIKAAKRTEMKQNIINNNLIRKLIK